MRDALIGWVVSLALGAASLPVGGDSADATQGLISRLSTLRGPIDVGQWATYRATSSGGSEVFLRLAAVSEESEEHSQQAVWLELEAGLGGDLRAPLVQLKLLCQKNAAGLSGKVLRAVAVVGHGQPRDVDPRRWAAGVPVAQDLPSGFSFAQGVAQKLPSSLGPLSLRPWELRYAGRVVQRIYLSDRVPLLHLVRLEVPPTHQTLELFSAGKGAIPHVPLPSASMSGEGLPREPAR